MASSGKCFSEKLALQVDAIHKRGKEQCDMYVMDAIINRTTPIDSSIRQNSCSLFKDKKQRKIQQPKVHLLKANFSLFSRLYIASTERKINLDTFFSHEVHSFPPSLASGMEQMYHSAKSDIIHHLEKEAETLTDRIVDNAIIYDCVVQDGGQLIHQLLPHAVGTFEEFTQMRLFSHL